jgi:photosystem II stability/assembly factor-like uncharacterized protein
MKRVLFVAVLLLAANGVEARRRTVRSPGPIASLACTQVTGFPAIAVSVDGGNSVLPQTEGAEGFQIHTFGLTATAAPDRLLAVTGRVLLSSGDAGCSWTADARLTFPDHLYRFASEGWAWSPLSSALFRIGDEGIEQRVAPVPLPTTFFADGAHLATADDQGRIWRSGDAGRTWVPSAIAPARAPLYSLAFASRHHAIATGMADGAHVTFDGGETWARSTGVDGLNLFRVAISPIDTNVIWGLGLDPRATPKPQRAIYRSEDGGKSFRRVVTASNDLPMTNATLLAPSPHDASQVYFTYPGTTLVLLDASGVVRLRAQLPVRDIDAILFSPAQPELLYFGLHVSDMS